MAISGKEALKIIEYFPRRDGRTVELKLPVATPEYDFITGAFWQTPIGQSLEEFAKEKLLDKSFPLPATTVSNLLKLRDDREYKKKKSNIIPELVKSGIIRDVKPGITRGHVFTLPQILVCDLVLYTLERGHNVQETVGIVSKAIKGTFLSDSLGKLDTKYPFTNVKSGSRFFSAKSHWQKLVPQDELRDTVIPPSGRIFDGSKVKAINFENGEFWQTSLGMAIEEVAESQRILEDLPFSLTTKIIAMALGATNDQRTASTIIIMVRRGLLVHPRRLLQEERNPSLVLPHLFISGLILSSLDHGESLASASVRLKDLLKGTSLELYIESIKKGEHDDEYPIKTKRTKHLKKQSPWSQLFLPGEGQQITEAEIFNRDNNDGGGGRGICLGYRPIPGKSLEIDIDVLVKSKEEEDFKAQELSMLRANFSNSSNGNVDTDDINVRRLHGFPQKFIGILAFVSAAVNRKLILYDTLLEEFTNYDFKMALLSCERLMIEYGVDSLKKMFEKLMEDIKKDPQSYWNAEQAGK